MVGHDNDDALAERYIDEGAQAYLLHEEIHSRTLFCAIAQARQHAHQLEALKPVSYTHLDSLGSTMSVGGILCMPSFCMAKLSLAGLTTRTSPSCALASSI